MLNTFFLQGRLTKDIEIFNSGETMYSRITLALNKHTKNPIKDDPVDFIDLTVFGKSAEYLSKYASKGSLITLSGNIGTYLKSGDKYKTISLSVDRIHHIQSKQSFDKDKDEENYENISIKLPSDNSQDTDALLPF